MSLMLRRSLLPSWMDEFFNRDLLSEMDLGESMSMPAVNVIEDKDAFRMRWQLQALKRKILKLMLTTSCSPYLLKKKYQRKAKTRII